MLGLLGVEKKILRVSDTFPRADSAVSLGSAETGQIYQVVSGTWGISANKAYTVTDTHNDRVIIETGLKNAVLESVVHGQYMLPDQRIPILMFRYYDVNNRLQIGLDNGSIVLYKMDGGAFTSLASVAQTTTDDFDYTLKIAYTENNIEIFVNGTSKITYVLSGGDTKYAQYTKIGMRLVKNGAPTFNCRWDNLKVEVA